MLVTKYGQTPTSLAEEFINAVRSSQVVSSDLVKLCDWYASFEAEGQVVPVTITERIAHAGSNPNSKLDTRQTEFYKNCQPNISEVFLAWVAMQSEGNPMYINSMLGLYSIYFYKHNPKDAQLTLTWVNSIVGSGKIFDPINIHPWYISSKTDTGKSIFEVITKDELYVYEGS